ncbi:unnamed protein product, partial [Heterosigma akashiwo]
LKLAACEESRSPQSKSRSRPGSFQTMEENDLSPIARLHKQPSVNLGEPLPKCIHSVSVSLPLWEHVVGYEEGDQKIISELKSGYPRFVFSQLVADLMALCLERFGRGELGHEACLLLPSEAAALDCCFFLKRYCDLRPADPALPDPRSRAATSRWAAESLRVHQVTEGGPEGALGVWAVLLPGPLRAAAKAYWQHGGRLVSSRRAAAALCELGREMAWENCDKCWQHAARSDGGDWAAPLRRLVDRVAALALPAGEQQA